MAAVLAATADLVAAGTPSAVHIPSVVHIPSAVVLAAHVPVRVLQGVHSEQDRSAGRFLRRGAGVLAQACVFAPMATEIIAGDTAADGAMAIPIFGAA